MKQRYKRWVVIWSVGAFSVPRLPHKQVGVIGGHFYTHRCSLDLVVEGVIGSEGVDFEGYFREFQECG